MSSAGCMPAPAPDAFQTETCGTDKHMLGGWQCAVEIPQVVAATLAPACAQAAAYACLDCVSSPGLHKLVPGCGKVPGSEVVLGACTLCFL